MVCTLNLFTHGFATLVKYGIQLAISMSRCTRIKQYELSQRTCLTPHLLLQLCVAGSHGEKHHFGIAIRTQEQHTLLSLSATQERFTCCNVFKLLHSTSVKIPSETGKRVRCDQGYTVTHVKSTLTVTRFDSDHN